MVPGGAVGKPPAARAMGGPKWDCDSDGDGPASVWVAQSFESTGGPAEVLRYYRQALPDDGWSGVDEGVPDEPGFEDVGGITCFRRAFEGRTAFPQVEFPGEDGLDTTKYALEVWAATAFNAEEACRRDGAADLRTRDCRR